MDLLNEIDNLSQRNLFQFNKSLMQIAQNEGSFDRNIKLEEIFNDRFENAEVYIFNIKSKQANAFTIPGITNLDQFLKYPILEYDKSIQYLNNNKLTAKKINSKIKFNRKIKFVIFLTLPLLKKITNVDILFAILLHEIGHWIYHKSSNLNQTFSDLVDYFKLPFQLSFSWILVRITYILDNKSDYNIYDSIILLVFLLYIVLILFRNYYFRKNEFDSDSFAIDMGYGKQLLIGLKQLDVDQAEYSKLQNIFELIKDKIFGILFHRHPSIQSREIELDNQLSLQIKNFLPWLNLHYVNS